LFSRFLLRVGRRTFCMMGQRVQFNGKLKSLKPLGVGLSTMLRSLDWDPKPSDLFMSKWK